MKKIKDFTGCFDKHGNFVKRGTMPFDPYRLTDDYEDMYHLLFCMDGECKPMVISEIGNLIRKNNWGPFTDAVKYMYAHNFDFACHGNYTAIYAWRLLLLNTLIILRNNYDKIYTRNNIFNS